MLRIDKAILDTNSVICENISKRSLMDRGFLSQNILSQLRNFVEYIAIKVYGNGQDIDPNNYDLRKAALHDMKKRWELRFLYRFHLMLQCLCRIIPSIKTALSGSCSNIMSIC